jgi:hypothetical protein
MQKMSNIFIHSMAYIIGVTPLRPEVGGVVKSEVLGFTYIVLKSLRDMYGHSTDF